MCLYKFSEDRNGGNIRAGASDDAQPLKECVKGFFFRAITLLARCAPGPGNL